MKSITAILDPIRRKIGQNEYFDILSQLEQNSTELQRLVGSMEEIVRDRELELDQLREQMRYAKREKDAAESFLADMTNQRNKALGDVKQLQAEVKALKDAVDDAEHEKAYKAHLEQKTKVEGI